MTHVDPETIPKNVEVFYGKTSVKTSGILPHYEQRSTHMVLKEKEVCALHIKGFNSPLSPTLKVKLLCKHSRS